VVDIESAKRFRKPNASVAGWKIVEPAEFPITEPFVELRRLKRESVEISRATALRSGGRFRAGHELQADPMLAIGVSPDSMARMVASLGDVSVAKVRGGVSLEAVTA
jgi:hypothetical protein